MVLFNDALSTSDYIVLNDGMLNVGVVKLRYVVTSSLYWSAASEVVHTAEGSCQAVSWQQETE